MWSALPPYLGGKRRLCPIIFRELDRILQRRRWHDLTFLDAFLGGGAVSLYAKAQGFRVVATDVAERSIVVGRALIENSRVKLAREDILKLASVPANGEPGRVERQYTPSVFTARQARFLDRALAMAETARDPSLAALYRLLAIRVALLAHPMSQVRAGTAHRVETGEFEAITASCARHYVDGLRLTRFDRLWRLAERINAGVFQGEAQVMRTDVVQALPEIEADVAYFDPPYPGVMAYEKEYRVIDEILEGAARPTSPFTARDGASLLDGLFERAQHIPVWLLSLGNAVVGIEELEGKMVKLWRKTRAIALRYQHLPAVATAEKKRENREFLVVGWDPSVVRGPRISVRGLGRPGGHDHPGSVPVVHDHARAVGTQGATPESSLGDRLEEREPALAEKIAPRWGEPVPELKGGLDDPDAVRVEAGLDRDREG